LNSASFPAKLALNAGKPLSVIEVNRVGLVC
jgi:hypothetical protein